MPRLVHREVEVVTAHTVDRSVHVAADGTHNDRGPPTAEVAQHERQGEPGRERVGARLALDRSEAGLDLRARQHEGGNTRERHNALGTAMAFVNDLGGEPVAPEGRCANGDLLAISQGDREGADVRTVGRRGCLVDCEQAITEGEAPESQPFLFGVLVELLGAQLLLELALEVVEQSVPAHAPTLATTGRRPYRLSTVCERADLWMPHICLSLVTPVRGQSVSASAPMGEPVTSAAARRHDLGDDDTAPEPPPAKQIRAPFDEDEFFGVQPAGRATLPNPEPLIENLTRCVIEILAGARDLEQIARWVDDDVYRHLLKRVVLSARARQAKGQVARRPNFTIGSMSICEPRDGVVEAVVIVIGKARTRAVALRLEGLDTRWRATAVNVL